MLNWNLPRHFARRTLALTAVFATGIAVMGAQTVAQPAAQATDDTPTVSATAQPQPVQSTALFSSSAAEAAPSPALEASLLPANPFGDPMQYGGGQRSRAGGRPRYRGNNSNPDGSNKYMFYAGFGLQQPVGNTYHYLTPSWALQVGGGRQFSKNFAVPVEFSWDNFGFAGQTLANQQYLLNNPNIFAGAISGLDGNSHVWSFALAPTYTFAQGEKWGAYGVAGVGFYHKTANFFVPATVQGYYYGYPVTYTANETIDKYTSNAPGFSGGLGLTYKFSRFSNERFYAEVRYVFVDNSARQGSTVATYSSITSTTTDLYPANSHHTTYFPIKFGIRF
jgi:hypothetical protein